MPFTEDLAGFFEPADFGTTAVYTPDGGQATSVNGIFDAAGSAILGMVEDTGPMFLCALADMPDVANGDTLTVDDVAYTIRASHPDGTGLVRLKLEEQ